MSGKKNENMAAIVSCGILTGVLTVVILLENWWSKKKLEKTTSKIFQIPPNTSEVAEEAGKATQLAFLAATKPEFRDEVMEKNNYSEEDKRTVRLMAQEPMILKVNQPTHKITDVFPLTPKPSEKN